MIPIHCGTHLLTPPTVTNFGGNGSLPNQCRPNKGHPTHHRHPPRVVLQNVLPQARSTDDSGQEEGQTIAIGDFEKSTSWLTDYKDADRDPDRITCVNDFPPYHKVPIKTNMTQAENRTHKEFVDAMFHQLSLPYITSITSTKQTVYVKARCVFTFLGVRGREKRC